MPFFFFSFLIEPSGDGISILLWGSAVPGHLENPWRKICSDMVAARSMQ